MRLAVGVLVVCIATVAQAKPRTFESFKLVSQRPGVHKNRTLHDRTKALHDSVAQCGELPAKATFPLMKLHVAADGSIADAEITDEHHALGDDMVTCVKKAVSTLTYPAQTKPSIVTWVLVYTR